MIDERTEPLTAKEIIQLVETLNVVLEIKIQRLKDYIAYRERRHDYDRKEIDELKIYLEEVLKNETRHD